MTWETISTFLLMILIPVTTFSAARASTWKNRYHRSERKSAAWRKYATWLEGRSYATQLAHTDPGSISEYRMAMREQALPVEADD